MPKKLFIFFACLSTSFLMAMESSFSIEDIDLTDSPIEFHSIPEGQEKERQEPRKIILNERRPVVETHYVGDESWKAHLIRNFQTPENISMRLFYQQRVCLEDMTSIDLFKNNKENSEQNEDPRHCIKYGLEQRSQTIHLNFSNSIKLEEEQTQKYLLVLEKSAGDESFNHQLKLVTTQKNETINEGRNFLGLFGHRYEIYSTEK